LKLDEFLDKLLKSFGKTMRLLEAGRLKQILRRATASFHCRIVILVYHRVFETSSDPWELCVSPKHFAEHLELLSRHYQVLSLHKLDRSLKDAQLPKRGVVLTFDDGYADNLWNARPLLEKYETPATVFITSGSLDSPTEFWWDDLQRTLLQPKTLPKHLQLSVQGRFYEWPITSLDDRQFAYMAIHQILQPLEPSDRNQVMNELFAWANMDPMARPDYRPLVTAELIQLAQSEFIDIGAHSVTHPLLTGMSQANQTVEIAGSRQKLEVILGCPVDAFSYPYGNLASETVEIVKAAGFKIALTTNGKAVEVGANPFRLGRFSVGDWDGEKFKKHLNNFFQA
jgi:peptidoglycan/xylan/chitin deacetylase (PgdA/CDA1 family)